jgi:enoyl-CoA hydratase
MVESTESPLLIQRRGALRVLVLNRPRVLNTLNLKMIRLLREAVEEARNDDGIWLLVLDGAGDRGFCAGGDLKELAQAVRQGNLARDDAFFREEYALDLMIHQFPKAVAVLAHGITMGGGLGLAAGADLVVATEATRMAMPETRIGFFPDVGATGWLFRKCPPGYPEYLALTGYEMVGPECVRLGLASHLVPADRLGQVREALAEEATGLPRQRGPAAARLRSRLEEFAVHGIPANPELDARVAKHLAGKGTVREIVESLRRGPGEEVWRREVLERLAERSPTALTVTLRLLRANEGRPLAEVFQREALAAHFMVQHPDYLEGIRARIIDKDDQPRWRPRRLEEVGEMDVSF